MANTSHNQTADDRARSSDTAANASTQAEQELRKAQEGLTNWSRMKRDEFESKANEALEATKRRIAEIRDQANDSAAADKARQTLTDLEQQRDQLAQKLAELRTATAEKFEAGKQSVADAFTDLQGRLGNAWDALRGR